MSIREGSGSVAHLERLFKNGAEVSEPLRSSKLPEDLPEKLLWVHGGSSPPVLLPRPAGTRPRRPVRVVLLSFYFVAQNLLTHTHTIKQHVFINLITKRI